MKTRRAGAAAAVMLVVAAMAGCGPSTWMATSPSAPWGNSADAKIAESAKKDPFPTASQSGLKAGSQSSGRSDIAIATDE